jgi:hypothetical protein
VSIVATPPSEAVKIVRGGATARVVHDVDARVTQLQRLRAMLSDHEADFSAEGTL